MRTVLAIGKKDAYYFVRKDLIGKEVKKFIRGELTNGSFISAKVWFKDSPPCYGGIYKDYYFAYVKLSKERK